MVEGVMGNSGTEPALKIPKSGMVPVGNEGCMPEKTSQLLMATMSDPSAARPRPAMRVVRLK